MDGVLVGESVAGTGNSFLCPVKAYGNFELELDYQVDDQLNSGVQFRSDLFPEARTLQFGSVSSKLPADRLHGYQCEIDMDTKKNRMWTAGIYDEARRGTRFPPTSKKRAGNCSGTANPTKAGAARSRKISPPRVG